MQAPAPHRRAIFADESHQISRIRRMWLAADADDGIRRETTSTTESTTTTTETISTTTTT